MRGGKGHGGAGLHDHPGIYPTLPPRVMDPATFKALMAPNRGTEWETCWEYVLTHALTDAEGAAFWTGANLAYEAALAARDGAK